MKKPHGNTIIDIEPQWVHNSPRVITRVFSEDSQHWPQEIGGRSCWIAASGSATPETANVSINIMPENGSDSFDLVMGLDAAEEVVKILSGLIAAMRKETE